MASHNTKLYDCPKLHSFFFIRYEPIQQLALWHICRSMNITMFLLWAGTPQLCLGCWSSLSELQPLAPSRSPWASSRSPWRRMTGLSLKETTTAPSVAGLKSFSESTFVLSSAALWLASFSKKKKRFQWSHICVTL